MNKKGFSLIELIVSIALISIIGTIIAVNMVSISKNQESKEILRQESTIKSAAEAYLNVENQTTITGTCVKINTLIDSDYLKQRDIKPYVNGSVKITDNDSDGVSEYTVYKDSEDCSGPTSKEYALKYNINDGSNTVIAVENYTYNSKATITSQTPEEREGYKFKGWSESKSNLKKIYKAGDKYQVKRNTTLYAVWEIQAKIEFVIKPDTLTVPYDTTRYVDKGSNFEDDLKIDKHIIKKMTCSGNYKKRILDSNKLTLKEVNGDTTCNIEYEQNEFEVKIIANNGKLIETDTLINKIKQEEVKTDVEIFRSYNGSKEKYNLNTKDALLNLLKYKTVSKGLYKTTDNNGETYLFHGLVDNNNIKFAGEDWKIVRINGDGTIRIIKNNGIDTTIIRLSN